jgi:hypothetical protein
VTRLAENTVENEPVRVLLTGIDTLDLGVYVTFDREWPRFRAKLAQYKQQARGTAGYVLPGGRYAVLPGGKPNYPFHVQTIGAQLYLSKKQQPDGDTPNVLLSLNAQRLWHLGVQGAVAETLRELHDLAGGTVQECRVSRCDLAADLQLPEPLTDHFLRAHAVRRAAEGKVYLRRDELATFYCGAAGSDVQLRIYDKSREIIHSEKFWFLPLWGLEVNAGVWRVEFQLRREFLRNVGINTLEELQARQGDLWRYLTEEWFSLRLQDNEHTSRRTVLPLWQVVQSCADRFGPAAEGVQRRRVPPSSHVGPTINHLFAALVGLGARTGNDSLDAALMAAKPYLQELCANRDFAVECQRKRLQLGLGPVEAHP